MSDIIKTEPKFEKFARFQALQAGHYWRALVDVPDEAIDKDEVLLIESIRWVDNSAHTIIMRAHPSKHGKYVQREITREDGSKTTALTLAEAHAYIQSHSSSSIGYKLLVSAPSEPYPVPASVIERWVEIQGSDKAAQ